MNAALDWLIRFLSGISQIITLFEDDDCKPHTASQEPVLQCVCGDKPYTISEEIRTKTAADWSFWCTGVLKMINNDGYEVFVYIDVPFDELRQTVLYKTCISPDSTTCSVYLRKTKENATMGVLGYICQNIDIFFKTPPKCLHLQC